MTPKTGFLTVPQKGARQPSQLESPTNTMNRPRDEKEAMQTNNEQTHQLQRQDPVRGNDNSEYG